MINLPVDPNWAPKEPVLLAAPTRTIYNLKFRLTLPHLISSMALALRLP